MVDLEPLLADYEAQATDLSPELARYVGRKVSYATHGIHRYPSKFIPQIPRLCLERYSRPGDRVLDPFMGSGTTLLETVLLSREAIGLDVHPLARLIAKVKLTPLDPGTVAREAARLKPAIAADRAANAAWIPEIPNRDHWFRPRVLRDLATIKKHVSALPPGPLRDFFSVCFSSVIRRVSNSDDDSLIPEVTSFQQRLEAQGKASPAPIPTFQAAVLARIADLEEYAAALRSRPLPRHPPEWDIFDGDARSLPIRAGAIDLAITSPPYASAVHYASVHKLELYWLDLVADHRELERRLVGTPRVFREEYSRWRPTSGLRLLDDCLEEIARVDQKSAYVVGKYFAEMEQNLSEVRRALRPGARYCLVAGTNRMCRVQIPTYLILDAFATRLGLVREATFVYDVINRHLDIPRWNESRIERDWVLVLQKA